jgi:hypothetical protein
MGKIASKYCKLCEANNEMGNANLEQTRMIIDHNADYNPSGGFSFNGQETSKNSNAEAKFQEEMYIFIEKNNCDLIFNFQFVFLF